MAKTPFRTPRPPDARTLAFQGDYQEQMAADRAEWWAAEDPFPLLEPALLSAVHIKNYARVTGMVHPYKPRRLKAASYEVGMGGQFTRWRDGQRIITDVSALKFIRLPPNSISYVQTDTMFRLPHYIGMRFNLQIAHVHRGLLLGTGPLVDPGFEGRLLIPLHNLTSSHYDIPATDSLIWVEFTKTSFNRDHDEPSIDKHNWEQYLFPSRKKNKSPDEYFQRASQMRPIESSIPAVIAQSKRDARAAAEEAKVARKEAEAARSAAEVSKIQSEEADRRLFKIGVGTLAAVGVAIFAIVLQSVGVVRDAATMVDGAHLALAKAEKSRLEEENRIRKINELENRIRSLENKQ